jgi:cytochrome c-type biogenesis protein CcmH
MTKKRTILIIILSLILVMGGMLLLGSRPVNAGAPAAAQAATQAPQPTATVDTRGITDDQVNRVAKQMYCPVCENIPLDVCPTQACHDWRELIRQKLAQGWTDQRIKDYFATQYGVRVLAEPPATGLNWLVYILPWVAFLGGVVIVWRVLVSMRRKPGAAAPGAEMNHDGAQSGPPVNGSDDRYLKELEEELRKKE